MCFRTASSTRTSSMGCVFKERTDLPMYAPGMRVFEAFNADAARWRSFTATISSATTNKAAPGSQLCLPVQAARHATRGGQCCQFLHAGCPQPALITSDDVRTMFHEMKLRAARNAFKTEDPSLSGTSNRARLAATVSSQFNEHWATYPTVFQHYAKHYKTGVPMLVELRRSRSPSPSTRATTPPSCWLRQNWT